MKENIEVFEYKNESKIIVENDQNANYVAFAINVAVGAGDETENQFGLAHFLEHLFFKSTKNLTTQQLVVKLENLGAIINAQTSDTRTVYHFQCLKENFEKCVKIFSDMFQNGLFLKEEIDRERQVVLEEILRSKDSPHQVAFINGFEALLEGTRFGHEVLGTENVIKNVTREEIIKFKEDLYTPNKIIFSICGNIAFEEGKEIVEKHFKEILFKTDFVERENSPISVSPKKKYILEEQDRNQAQVYVMFNSIKATDENRIAVQLFQNILGGGMSSRLFTELREKYGLAYSTWAEFYSCKEFGIFGIYIGTHPSKVKFALENIKRILTDLAKNGATEEELVKAKNKVKSSKVFAQDSKISTAKLNATKFAVYGTISSLEEEFKEIDEITLQDVNNIAKTLFEEEKFVVSVVGKGIEKKDVEVF